MTTWRSEHASLGEPDLLLLERSRMVAEQILGRGIRDERVLGAMRRIPRHLFVPEGELEKAYCDAPLPIGEGQTISQPYMVALMTETLKLQGDERVLEIGTGSGYQTAILAELANSVRSVERIDRLAEESGKRLKGLGYRNVLIRVGDGSLGWPEQGPYDRILITAGSPALPAGLVGQLSEDGMIVGPLGDRDIQMLTRFEMTPTGLERTEVCSCRFVPLIGEQGWPED